MSSDVASAGFYADFGALSALKQDLRSNDPQALRAVARQFESLFTDMMLQSMRAAKLGDGLGESQETDFYQDMYDHQLALQMSQGKGLGLADLLVQQLTRNHAAGSGAAAGAQSGAASASGSAAAAAGAAPIAGTAGTGGNAASGKGSARAQRISFVRMLEPYAQRAAAQLGVSPDSLIAQAALETGWGQQIPASGDGSSSNNLFGVKAGAAYSGGVTAALTSEYRQGSALTTLQNFRAYGSLQQGVDDYVALLRGSGSYQSALGTGSDVAAFASALQRGGYATDPRYAAKITATAAEVQALRAAGAPALKTAAELPTTTSASSA